MRSLMICAVIALLAFGSLSRGAEKPEPFDKEPTAPKTITLYVNCASGKCTPVKVPVGSLVTTSGGIIVPAYVRADGVQVYRDHPDYKGSGSCQGSSCSGPASCGASGSCSSCTTCTAARRASYVIPAAQFHPVRASSSCPNCPK